MARENIEPSEDLLTKLELLRILSEREDVDISELTGLLGRSIEEIRDIVGSLRENYMITLEKSRVIWRAGDNPRRIRPWGWRYIYRTYVGSTMISARYYGVWSIVIAEYQSRSYGRHGKQWISNLGGVWMTLKFETSPRAAEIAPISVPVAICRYLNQKLSIEARIKWPNDIVVNEKKLAGFLMEAETLLDKIIVYLGFGINVNNDPPIETAISLKNITGRLIPRNSIIPYIAGAVLKLEETSSDIDKLQLQYLDLLETLGKRIRVVTKKGVLTGLAKTINERGDLVVETDTGSFTYSSSDVLELRYID